MRFMYFAYGSNMSSPRLQARVASARPLSVARLHGHQLRFHKLGKDQSGKCDAHHTARTRDCVIGVLYEMAAADKPHLDRAEGLGCGYAEKTVLVRSVDGAMIEVNTYYATRIDASLSPYDWYKEHVLRGAAEHGLPAHYVEALRAVASVADPDAERRARELAVYADVIMA